MSTCANEPRFTDPETTKKMLYCIAQNIGLEAQAAKVVYEILTRHGLCTYPPHHCIMLLNIFPSKSGISSAIWFPRHLTFKCCLHRNSLSVLQFSVVSIVQQAILMHSGMHESCREEPGNLHNQLLVSKTKIFLYT